MTTPTRKYYRFNDWLDTVYLYTDDGEQFYEVGLPGHNKRIEEKEETVGYVHKLSKSSNKFAIKSIENKRAVEIPTPPSAYIIILKEV